MDNFKPEQKANIYNHHFRQLIHKKSIETSQTINDSLPNIQQNKSQEKANVLRNQLNDTRSQIVIMEAKLRNLQKIKEKHELKNQQNITKIQFMNNVKERVRNDFEYKQKVRHQKQEQLSMLKQQTEYIRQSLVSQRKNAQNSLYTIKVNEAEEERRRKKQQEYLIKKLRELDTIENSRKVERVKEFHQQSASRLQEFHESRVNYSKDNYLKKVTQTLRDKERAKSVLQKLKQEQQKMMNDVKSSEKAMLTSLYSLQTLNPQKRRKRFNSIDKMNKLDVDYYSNQEFQA